MATILMPLPSRGFDPTETGVPWRILNERGHRLVFATPDGKPGEADARMVTGKGLGLLARLLRADDKGRSAYCAMEQSPAFKQPIVYDEIRERDFDAMLLPGGHDKGMRPYLESAILQATIGHFFARLKPVGAICHGVLLVARSPDDHGRSVLYGRRTTALTKRMELTAWALTVLYLGDYYRTYKITVEDEVKPALARPEDFVHGPLPFMRDSPSRPELGFVQRDGNYLSARWPGDAHRFARYFAAMLERPNT